MSAKPSLQLLLIEDNAPDAALIQANLRIGLGQVSIARVERLADAFDAMATSTFAVILLDLNLPDSSGVQTFKKLSARCNGTPIVVLSGLDDTQTATNAVAAGAEDYVQKNHCDAETLARSVRFAIERSTRMLAERELISVRSELTAAQQIQDSLYPEAAPLFEGIDIASGIRSAGTGCGDYFDFIPLHDGRQIIVVGDVSGHGMGSAMVMAETRASLRTLADVGADVGVMYSIMDRLITGGTFDDMFVTLLMVIHDPENQTFEYLNAGHPGWIMTAGQWTHVKTHRVPLGFGFEEYHPTTQHLQLQSGDIVLMPTDGIQEAPGEDGLFGKQRMLQVVEEHRNCSAQEIVDRLFEATIRFTGDQPLNDDMTVIVIKVL